MQPAAQGSPAAVDNDRQPKNFKEAQAVLKRLQEESNRYQEENKRLQEAQRLLLKKMERMRLLLPFVVEDEVVQAVYAGKDTLGDLTSLRAKQVPGTHLHYRYLQESLTQQNTLTTQLREALKSLEQNYSTYEGEKRQRILDLSESKRELQEEIKGFVPAELARQAIEAAKEKKISPNATRFQDGGVMSAEWTLIKEAYQTFSETVQYLEGFVYPLRPLKELAAEFQELSKALETCRQTFDEKNLEVLREKRTELKNRLRGLSESYSIFTRTPKPIELQIKDQIVGDYTLCETEEQYTHHLIDIIEYDQSLLHPVRALAWEPIQQARLLRQEQGSFQQRVEQFVQLHQHYEANGKLTGNLKIIYDGRIKFLAQNVVTNDKCRAILSQQQHQLKTAWDCTHLNLIEFQFELMMLAYQVGGEVRGRTASLKLAIYEATSILRYMQSQQKLPNTEEVKVKTDAYRLLLSEESNLRTIIHHLCQLGGTLGMFSPQYSLEGDVLKNSQEKVGVDKDRKKMLKDRYVDFVAQSKDYYQSVYELHSLWEILSAHTGATQSSRPIRTHQESLLQRAQIFLTHQETLGNQAMIDAFDLELKKVETEKLEFDQILEQIRHLETKVVKAKDSLSKTLDLLGEQLVEPNHFHFVEMTKLRHNYLLATVAKNQSTLTSLWDQIRRITPSRKLGSV